jgi:hypothetical protein
MKLEQAIKDILINPIERTVDQVIQHMLKNYTDNDLENIEWLARNERESLIKDYKCAYGWTIAQCEEFIENAVLAYELLVKECAA